MLHLRSIFLAFNLLGFCALAALGWLGVTMVRSLQACIPPLFYQLWLRRSRRRLSRFPVSLRNLDEVALKWNGLAR